MIKNITLLRQKQKLDRLFKIADENISFDEEILSEWARYLTVRCAGFLENSIREIYVDFVRSAASPHVINFTTYAIGKIQNPKTNRFIEIASAFKREWGKALSVYVEEEGRKDAIDSIMNNRHQIAHGKDTGVSLGRIKGYYSKSLEVVEYIERQCTS